MTFDIAQNQASTRKTHFFLPQYWAGLIEDAEAPNPLSSRDGKLLRLVPLEKRLTRIQLADNLEAVLDRRLRPDCEDMLCQACISGSPLSGN